MVCVSGMAVVVIAVVVGGGVEVDMVVVVYKVGVGHRDLRPLSDIT